MDVSIVLHPGCEHRNRIKAAVADANRLQLYFRLKCVEADWLPNDADEEEVVDNDEVHALIAERMPGQCVIAVTQSPLAPDWFVDERRSASVITLSDWETRFAPPPVRVYLLFHFANALLNFAADLSDEQIEQWSHRPAIGCAFDWYMNAREMKRCMIAANLCGTCEVRLAEMGIPDRALAAVEQILGFVRAATMRRPRGTPTDVFIGHGRSEVWRQVRDYVADTLGLRTQEFNQEATAGVSTTERLQDMLTASGFAILVMTGEDEHKGDGGASTIHARENVVHEVGLFQGRLGFRRAVILLEQGTTQFSNIHGLTYIPFPKGDFAGAASAQNDLKRALEREGML